MLGGRNALLRAVCGVALACGLASCATYSERIDVMRAEAGRGDYEGALASLNRVLSAEDSEPVPKGWDGKEPLAVLERAVVLQALGRYRASAEAFGAAETQLEVLDLSGDAEGALAEYLYSGAAKKYRTPPSERLALNAINLLNYLALGDLSGAAVEARRFQVMREYLDSIGGQGPVGLGAYLAGFVFEKLGEPDRALRYYEDAMADRSLRSLDAPVARLARTARYRGPGIEAALERSGAEAGSDAASGGLARNARQGELLARQGELLVVASVGRVPYRVPERIGVGAAIGIAGTYATGDLRFLERGVAKVVVYPELAPAQTTLYPRDLRVDGRTAGLELISDLAAVVRREYQDAKPRILAAALVRLAARAAVAEGMRAAGREQSDALGVLAALATEMTLVAFDRPDTRSWNLLPAHVYATRLWLPPGNHEVVLTFENGLTRSETVTIVPGGYAAVIATEPR